MTEYNENVTDEQNAAVEENFEGEYTATDAVNEEFVASIGDSVASEDDTEQVEAEPVVFEGTIQTVGRRKEAVVRVRMVPGSGEFSCNGRSL